MIKTIWKFPIRIDDEQVIEMPEDAIILDIQMQGDTPCLWALVEPGNPVKERKILVAGTGHEREDLAGPAIHIGSFQMLGGRLVFHAFELLSPGL